VWRSVKLYAECISCQVQVRLRDVQKLVEDEDKRVELMKKIVSYLNSILSMCSSRYDNRCTPTVISTELFRFVKKATGVNDPYREEKIIANKEALKIYEEFKKRISRINNLDEKLVTALKISLVGNLIDLGVANYNAPELNRITELIDTMDIYGDIEKSIDILKKSRRIAIIMDNAGEAVLDRVLGDILKAEGKYVIAIVKGASFQNDITYSEIESAKLLESFDEVISTNTDASSIFLDEVGEEFLAKLRSFDVIISKGMANYEYLTEVENVIGVPIIYVLVAKCLPVARDLGVPRGKAVIKISKHFVH
jgi:uncharacterized protein with ATP-grasp and redox domains